MSLFFEEIDGQKRRVLLKDSEAPFGGQRVSSAFNLGGEVRKKSSWETGVRAPVVHITGTKELPIEVEFHLRDSMSGIAGNARNRMLLIDSIRLAARPVRVVWNGELRRGIIDKFEAGVEAPGEFKCKLVFDVWDQGDEPAVQFKPAFSLPTSAKFISDTVTNVAASLKIPGLSFDVSNTLTALFAPAFSLLGEFISLAEDFDNEAIDIFNAGLRLMTSLDAMLARIQSIVSFVEQVGEFFFDEPIDALYWRRKQAEALAALDQVLTQTYASGVAVETRMQQLNGSGTGSRTHNVRQGDTLENIARRYDVTFESLVDLNPDVPAGRLTEGTIVRIP